MLKGIALAAWLSVSRVVILTVLIAGLVWLVLPYVLRAGRFVARHGLPCLVKLTPPFARFTLTTGRLAGKAGFRAIKVTIWGFGQALEAARRHPVTWGDLKVALATTASTLVLPLVSLLPSRMPELEPIIVVVR